MPTILLYLVFLAAVFGVILVFDKSKQRNSRELAAFARRRSDQIQEIEKWEQEMLDAYDSTLRTYISHLPRDVNAVLRLDRETDAGRADRPVVSPGYRAFITLTVLDRQGNVIESEDHDMYMDFAWRISVYRGGMVEVEDEVDDDFEESLKSYLEFFRNPY